jgi:hypothetical protein
VIVSPSSLPIRSVRAYRTDYDDTTKWMYLCMKDRTDKKLHKKTVSKKKEIGEKYVLLLVSVTVRVHEENERLLTETHGDRNA